MQNKRAWAAPCLALGLYLSLTLAQLDLPGLHYDEAKEAGLPAMQMLLGQPLEPFRGSAIHLAGRAWPLMVQDYIGALNAYLLLPFFALGGVQVVSLRCLAVLQGALTLLVTWDLARRLYSPRAAAAAACLLAVQPAFVFWSRQGLYVTAVTGTLLAVSLWSGWRWWQEGRRRWVFVTALAWGLGLWAKLLFVWTLGGLAVCWVLLRGRARPALPHPVAGRDLAVAALLLALPLAPLVVFNLQTQGTFQAIFGNLTSSYYGVDNLAIGPNLALRARQLWEVLAGSPFWYLGGTFQNRAWPLTLGAAAAAVVVALLGRLVPQVRKRHLVPYLLLAAMVLQSCVTVSALWHSHFAILMPLPALALGGTLDALAARLRARPAAWAMAGVVVLLMAGDVAVDLRYHRALAMTGGLGGHTPAIYGLAAGLDQRGDTRPLAFDWGIAAPVQFLTAGRVQPVEVFGYASLEEPDGEFAGQVQEMVRRGHRLHVFHSLEETIYRGRLDLYSQTLANMGLAADVVQTHRDRSGRLIFVVGQAGPGSSAP
ncbi:MAG: glycosyltransferase family 39 protein [Chloroflexi bacterium]|nr:glycosyltransferase family 39 protein [Chloroflexota bacterium]